jgi:non-specific serine/threonine protein kinase
VAADYLERAVAAFQAIDDSLSLIGPLAALGFCVGLRGEPQRAMQLVEESVALARRTGSTGRLAIASIYFGQVALAQGDIERAVAAFEEGLKVSREWESAWSMAECLEGLAVAAGATAQADRAARLLGAAGRLRVSIGAPVHPVDRADHERTVALVRSAIGDEAFAAAFAAGQAAGLDEVIEYATSGRAAAAARVAHGLSPREREVAVLIARGLTNRQIADTLVIAERTVTNHVEHILNKLGFSSRSQVASWITQQQQRSV